MLIALALAAAAQTAAPPPVRLRSSPNRPCAGEGLEYARNTGVLFRHGDRPAELRRLDELPDADMILTIYRMGRDGCPVLDIVQRNVSTRGERGAVRERRILPPQGRPERQR